MKNQRQNLIMQIVKDENIGTQEELREALKRHGLKVTQATVSRDIKELSLVKTIGSDGNYKHSLPMKLRKKLLPRKKLRRKRKSPKSPRKFSMKSLLPLICLRK